MTTGNSRPPRVPVFLSSSDKKRMICILRLIKVCVFQSLHDAIACIERIDDCTDFEIGDYIDDFAPLIAFQLRAHSLVKQKVSTRGGMEVSEMKTLDVLSQGFINCRCLKF